MNENKYLEENNGEQNLTIDEPACEKNDILPESAEEDTLEIDANDDVSIEIIEDDGVESEVSVERDDISEPVSMEIIEEAEKPVMVEKKEQPAMGMAITSMILAIVSHVLGGGLPLSIIALALAVTAQKKGNTTGFAIAGKVIALISTILWSVMIVAFILIIFVAMLFAV